VVATVLERYPSRCGGKRQPLPEWLKGWPPEADVEHDDADEEEEEEEEDPVTYEDGL